MTANMRSAPIAALALPGVPGSAEALLERTVSRSVALVHSWRAGELLFVDNHTMLHSRAPFAGLRHMLRFRYDDPLHPTVIIGR